MPYHKQTIPVRILDRNLAFYIGLDTSEGRAKNSQIFSTVFTNPQTESLSHHVINKRVGLIIEDATREVPLEDLLDATGKFLRDAADIRVFIATGTHDGENEGNYQIIEEIEQAHKKFGFPLEKIIINNCHEDSFIYAGTTAANLNDIFIHRDSMDVDVFVVFSEMKNHYFAGYSNPIKNFIPGICNYETTERNHALALNDASTFGHHPLHPDHKRRDNPLAQDMWEAYQLVTGKRPTYVVATITKKNDILWAGAGLLEDITPIGISQVDKMMSTQVDPADYLIVSCGGYPNDESLYSAQRALELSKNGVKKGGEILFVAACANGIGPDKSIRNFYEPLKEDIPRILSKLQEKYIMYSHKTYKFARLIEDMNRISVISTLPEDTISQIHLTPVMDAQSVVDSWLNKNHYTKIGIVNDGNKLALY